MWMEIEKSKVLIKFLLNFRQSGDVLFFLNVRRLRGYTATLMNNYFYRFLQVKSAGSLNYSNCYLYLNWTSWARLSSLFLSTCCNLSSFSYIIFSFSYIIFRISLNSSFHTNIILRIRAWRAVFYHMVRKCIVRNAC